jgi:hypothetical protein
MWFERLTGFRERSPQQVRGHMRLDGEMLTSVVNGKSYRCGRLETPSLAELRERVGTGQGSTGRLSVREVVADVQGLHVDSANAGTLFQVASQFNLLEMVSPHVTPEEGVGIYSDDHTQGPACAIAAGAGTIYRNYLAPVNGQIGQTAGNQIDSLADIGRALGNTDNRLWMMQNGYALASYDGLVEISDWLRSSSERELDGYRRLLRIGIQWNTQVTLDGCQHRVSQAHCSALPVAYGQHDPRLWSPFARLILDASYEATLLAAILNWRETGNSTCYLTLLGGGVFGNPTDWIKDAIQRSLTNYAGFGLDVAIVSYGASKRSVQRIIDP